MIRNFVDVKFLSVKFLNFLIFQIFNGALKNFAKGRNYNYQFILIYWTRIGIIFPYFVSFEKRFLQSQSAKRAIFRFVLATSGFLLCITNKEPVNYYFSINLIKSKNKEGVNWKTERSFCSAKNRSFLWKKTVLVWNYWIAEEL